MPNLKGTSMYPVRCTVKISFDCLRQTLCAAKEV